MTILGVDPGLAITGWGVLTKQGAKPAALNYGAILTKAKLPLPDRLLTIYRELKNIIKEYRPETLAVEQLFFLKEAHSLAGLAQARGVILLAAKEEGLEIAEYNPRLVKIAITGFGSADKAQMQKMITMLLSLKEIPKPDDVADALAIALCHLNSAGSRLEKENPQSKIQNPKSKISVSGVQ